MPKGGGFPMPSISIGILVSVFLLALLLSFSVLILPISPTLKATFKISSHAPPTFEVVDASYDKVSLLASTTTTKGNITLSYLAGTSGAYSLFIAVDYGGETLSTGMFRSLGDGLYQISIVYLPRLGEQPSIPYVVSFTLLASNGQKITDVVVTIYPT